MSKIFVILSVFAMALATSACGSSSNGAVAACEASCVKIADLACENGMDNDTCLLSCASYGMGVAPDSCLEAYEAYAVCANAVAWECNSMGMAGPADTAACMTESEAYIAACQTDG